MNDLGAVSLRFKQLIDFGFDQLNSNEIKLRIKQWMEGYTSINHKMNEVSKILIKKEKEESSRINSIFVYFGFRTSIANIQL